MEIGASFGRYQIREHLAEGGMGEVYRAYDEKLGRDVAVKLIRGDGHSSAEARSRFDREARLLASLNHPGIAAIYSIEEAGDQTFLVLELVTGETLGARLAHSPAGLRLANTLDVGRQIADALQAAHSTGIIHRDVKPANIMLTDGRRVKLLDFGIARASVDRPVASLTTRGPALTAAGTAVGTVPYMSPEQVLGESVDARCDIWALGCVLFEMLTGRMAFARATATETVAAILDRPAPLELLPSSTPRPIRTLVGRCLEKDTERRPASMRDVASTLARVAADLETAPQTVGRRRKRIFVAAVVLAAAAASSWIIYSRVKTSWARDVALPRIEGLIAAGRTYDAVDLAKDAGRFLGDDPKLTALWPRMAQDVRIVSNPSGARVWVSDDWPGEHPGPTGFAGEEWDDLGRTPIDLQRLPIAAYRLRLETPGHDTLETALVNRGQAGSDLVEWHLTLSPHGAVAPGMVMIDTNAEFQEFVKAGGYRNPELWQHEFVRDGSTVSWQEASVEFRDRSGRPGPSTWEGGTYPSGREAYPVAGVSWFEAAAYARFVGASLPTVYHWTAARDGAPVNVASFGNYRGDSTYPIGSAPFGPFGIHDLAGNVREWTWNASGERRYVLGGSFGDPLYSYGNGDTADPFDRSEHNGIRLADYLSIAPDSLAPLMAPIERPHADFSWGDPVDDDVYAALARRYDYDAVPLDSTTELVATTSPYWRRETVAYSAAYDGERIPGHLFLPKNTAPPYQTVLYFPGAGAIRAGPADRLNGEDMIARVVKSGRAVLFPIYKDTYQRFDGFDGNTRTATQTYVERKVRWIQDVRRSVDYLETRADIDPSRLAYWGVSWGAELAPIVLAVEPRFRAGLLMDGGAILVPVLPEADESSFAPRVGVPVLMINGRHDYIFPVESTQVPFFELLGTAAEDKSHILFDTGHIVAITRFDSAMQTSLDWLDRYLGPVR